MRTPVEDVPRQHPLDEGQQPLLLQATQARAALSRGPARGGHHHRGTAAGNPEA